MSEKFGFKKISEKNIPELDSVAVLYKHEQTDAELLSMINSDNNKVFGITFRTPPDDSTGVAHILEHSVLCGSRKYPVKEPFVELMKSSLQTFLNAMTYPDKTCYPVASQNLQDFYNLIDVYMDAVFYPVINKHIFQQEGWHLTLENVDAPLLYKGVVYNEMKGAYSSPDSLLAEFSQKSLFPDTTYGFDSGGNPAHIPDLTYVNFREFHNKYYHPGNARIFFYGNDDPEERLRISNEYLKDFTRQEIFSGIELQKPLEFSERMERSFPSGDDSSQGGMITLNWLLGCSTDIEMNFALQALTYILVGMSASPLKKALIESGLGEDLAGVGFENELRQMFFSVGLKGVKSENIDKVEPLIFDTLKRIVDEGFDDLTVQAALNTIEFKLRENNTGAYPQGLSVMLRSLTTWLYDADPTALIAFESPFGKVKNKCLSDSDYLINIIRESFLSNNHRTTVVFNPDQNEAAENAEREAARLKEIRDGMSSENIQQIMSNNMELKRLQETPDTPEDLASMPSLELSDLHRKNILTPLDIHNKQDARIYYHDIPTNGILYMDAGFDISKIPCEYISYIPVLGRAFLEMGTLKEDFVAFSQRISGKTGGINRSIYSSSVRGSGEVTAWMFFRCRAMEHQASDLLDILKDMFLHVKLDNKERLRQKALESRTRMEHSLTPSGTKFINVRLSSHFNDADYAAEMMGGISYLFFLRKLIDRIDNDWNSVLNDLNRVRDLLVNRNSVIINATVEEKIWKNIKTRVYSFLQSMPESNTEVMKWQSGIFSEHEALVIPAQVNYVGKAINLYQHGYKYNGSVKVITRYLRTGYLWDRIRVQGGAYGAVCSFDYLSGVLSLLSYRDPNILKTLAVFDEAAHFLNSVNLSQEELNRNITGAIGEIDSYLLPDARGYTSMIRSLNRADDNFRQQMRDEIFETDLSDFREFADVIGNIRESGLVKVLAGKEAIREAVAGIETSEFDIVNVL